MCVVCLQDLNCLIERYLEPLKEETFLSGEELEQLFGNIQEMVQFQRLFLQSLEEAVELETDFNSLTEPAQFRVRTKYMCTNSVFNWPGQRSGYVRTQTVTGQNPSV